MLWAFFGMLIAIIVLNEVLFYYGEKKLSYGVQTDKNVYEIGEEITLTPVIENRKILSIPFLTVTEYYGEKFSESQNTYHLFVMPLQRITLEHKIHGKERGLHTLDGAQLKMTDLLGFHNKFLEKAINQEVIILPRRKNIRELIMPFDSLHGAVSVKRWIVDDPLMLRGVREYTGRESQRYIHWPSSLKHQRILVKQFDFTTDRSAMVFLSMESSRPYWKDPDVEALEESIITARAVLEELMKERIPAGFSSNGYNAKTDNGGVSFPPGLSPKNLEKYTMLLGKMGVIVSESLETSLKKISRNRSSFQVVVLIVPKVLKEHVVPINEFSKNGKLVLIAMREDHLTEISGNVRIYKGRDFCAAEDT
ncbi:MAG: DUF58 domain-containing protein [Clostridium sp.]|nr:DUF58 domain-containing protein [Clostridium sp.]